jgi:hypothetical protein
VPSGIDGLTQRRGVSFMTAAWAGRRLSADAGYCSAANLRTLSRRRIKGYIATGRQKHGSKSATAKRPAKPGSLLARMTSRLRRAGHRSR